jgi:hypothetical protein
VSAVATHGDTALVTDPPATVRSAPRLSRPGEVSLEELILGAWEDLARDGRAECPVCGGRIGRGRPCDGCGSELS